MDTVTTVEVQFPNPITNQALALVSYAIQAAYNMQENGLSLKYSAQAQYNTRPWGAGGRRLIGNTWGASQGFDVQGLRLEDSEDRILLHVDVHRCGLTAHTYAGNLKDRDYALLAAADLVCFGLISGALLRTYERAEKKTADARVSRDLARELIRLNDPSRM